MVDYCFFSDEQLVKLNKTGDQLAFDELCSRYIKNIRAMARTYYLVGGDEEDLWQEGLIGLFSAVNAYDEDRNGASAFRTFAFKCIKSRILNAINGARAEKHKALNDSVSIMEFTDSEANIFTSSPEEKAIGIESLNELIKKIKKTLSPFEAEVFDLYVDGMKYNEIAVTLKKSPKSVDNAIQRIKEKTKGVR